MNAWMGGATIRSFSSSPLASLSLKSTHLKKIKNILFILFLERGKGREKERERNINVRLPLGRPLLGTWPETRHVP